MVAVESAARLNERARRHLADNALDADAREPGSRATPSTSCGGWSRRFDLVVCDPPPLVRRRADLDAGARAYKDLNRQALLHLAPGGFLLTFSCSAAVDAQALPADPVRGGGRVGAAGGAARRRSAPAPIIRSE